MTLHSLLVILREVAGSMRCVDSATSLRYAQNDRRGCVGDTEVESGVETVAFLYAH